MRPQGILLNANVSARLRRSLDLPVSEWEDGLKDWAFWERASKGNLVILTQDADFSERMLAQEPPSWVVHICSGIMRIQDLRALLDDVWPRVWELQADHKLVVVYRDRLGGM